MTANGLIAATPAPIPRAAPEFVIQQTNGQQLLLSSYKGKNVVLALMYATCSHCQHTAGLLNDIFIGRSGSGTDSASAQIAPGDCRVCVCNEVSRSTIQNAIAAGARDIAEIGRLTLAGTGCGTCRGELAAMVIAAQQAASR